MKWMMAVMAITVAMMSHISFAEEKLFITDVLEAKEMEASVSVSYFHDATEISSQLSTLNVDQTVDIVSSQYSLNMGLGRGFEVGVGVPYVFSKRVKVEYPTIPSASVRIKEEGLGDLSLRGKYRMFDETDKPFALVAGLGVKLETAPEDDGGTGTTDIRPFVAASTTVGQGLQPYAIYELIARNHGKSDIHAVVLGAEKKLNDNVGLRTSLEVDFHTSAENLGSFESYYFAVQAYIRLFRDLYLIPRIDYGTHSSAEVKEIGGHFDSSTSVEATCGFYCLF